MVLDKESAQMWLLTEVEKIYVQLSKGCDVSPSQRFSLEGQVKLLRAFDLVNDAHLKESVNQLYVRYFNEAVNPIFWQWMEDENSFYLPMKMSQAPVYKN